MDVLGQRSWLRRDSDLVPGRQSLILFSAWLCLFGLAITARSQEAPKGLSKDQVVKLLREDPAARVQYLVNKYGIGFYLTPEIENELTQVGATPELLDLMRKLAPAKPVEVKAPPPPLPAPVLIINAKPGEAEVYVDDERRGQTSAEGMLRVSGLAPGSHQLRLSLAGYRSFEVKVELVAGEVNTVVASLLAAERPAAKKDEAAEGANAAVAAPPKTPSDPNNPLTPHDPGIYYVSEKGSAHQLLELEQAPSAGRGASSSRGRSLAGGFGGGGIKWKSMIYGSKARIRLAAGRPVFYFYFSTPESAGGYDSVFRPSTSPNGFLLVHLQGKKNEREIPAKGSVTATVETKDLIPFDYEKVATGIYKVQLRGDLGAGEYGFLFGGVLQAMGDVSLFDFGVDGGK